MCLVVNWPGNSQKQTDGQLHAAGSSTSGPDEHGHAGDSDSEVLQRAQEQGRVNVLFPGSVTQEGCCRFVSEILKCILYQRQQLPMTYEQLVYSQKKPQVSLQVSEETVNALQKKLLAIQNLLNHSVW